MTYTKIMLKNYSSQSQIPNIQFNIFYNAIETKANNKNVNRKQLISEQQEEMRVIAFPPKLKARSLFKVFCI